MEDAAAVRGLERARNLQGKTQRFVGGQRAAERSTLDILQDTK